MTIVVYGKLTNPQCFRTIKALRKMKVAYKRRHIDELPVLTDQDMSIDRTHQPVVVTDDDRWTGWRPDKLDQLAAA